MQQKFNPRPDINLPQFNVQITPKIVIMGLGVIALLWLLSGTYKVGQQESGLVLRFGKHVRVVGPGLHWHMPFPVETVIKPKVTEVKREEIGFRTIPGTSPARYRSVPKESLMLTGDENIIDIDIVVQYKISDPVKYVFHIRNQVETVRTSSEAAIRHVIGESSIDDALTEKKSFIQDQTQQKLQEILDGYDAGILIVSVKLQDVQTPEQVIDAFKDVSSAIQDKEKAINEAEGYRNNLIPEARGQAEQLIRQAEAFSGARIRRSQGDADRFLVILREYNKAKDVTKRRLYIEAMEQILPEMEKYIIDSSGGGGIFNLLNLNKAGGGK